MIRFGYSRSDVLHMTPREIFANSAYAEKLRGEASAVDLNIATVAALSASGGKNAGHEVDKLFKDLTDFELVED